MNILRSSKKIVALAFCSVVVISSQTSYAHVGIIAPNGGENLEIGSTVTISWQIVIPHNLLNWDLFYSTTGAGGTLIPIAIDIPAGDPTINSIHTFEWSVPNTPSNQVRLSIVMDNVSIDYGDISDADITISATSCCVNPGDANSGGDTNIGDATFIVKYIFSSGLAPLCCDQADADAGGDVNIGDATYIVKFIFQSGAAPVCPVPGGLVCP